MLYTIADQLGFPGLLNLIRYISFRAGAASATALAIGLLLGPWFIAWLRQRQGTEQGDIASIGEQLSGEPAAKRLSIVSGLERPRRGACR